MNPFRKMIAIPDFKNLVLSGISVKAHGQDANFIDLRIALVWRSLKVTNQTSPADPLNDPPVHS